MYYLLQQWIPLNYHGETSQLSRGYMKNMVAQQASQIQFSMNQQVTILVSVSFCYFRMCLLLTIHFILCWFMVAGLIILTPYVLSQVTSPNPKVHLEGVYSVPYIIIIFFLRIIVVIVASITKVQNYTNSSYFGVLLSCPHLQQLN